MKSVIEILCLFLVLSFLSSPILAQQQGIDTIEKSRIQKWQEDLKAQPLPANAIHLEHRFFFPGEHAPAEAFMRYGANLCVDSRGNIYVSDSRNHTVNKFNDKGEFLKSFGRRGKGPGDLLNPAMIAIDPADGLVVYDTDNGRIAVFNLDGSYKKSFRVFESYSSMLVDGQGLIYCSPFEFDKPLVRIFSDSGQLKESFGHRLIFKQPIFGLNKVFMSRNSKGETYVAWELFPLVRCYGADFRLLTEYELKQEKMLKNAKFNRESIEKQEERREFRVVIAGLRAKEDGFYIFQYYPRIEILEYNSRGEVEHHYWTEQPYDFIGNDFYVKPDTNGKTFYILQAFPENIVSVYWTGKRE